MHGVTGSRVSTLFRKCPQMIPRRMRIAPFPRLGTDRRLASSFLVLSPAARGIKGREAFAAPFILTGDKKKSTLAIKGWSFILNISRETIGGQCLSKWRSTAQWLALFPRRGPVGVCFTFRPVGALFIVVFLEEQNKN